MAQKHINTHTNTSNEDINIYSFFITLLKHINTKKNIDFHLQNQAQY